MIQPIPSRQSSTDLAYMHRGQLLWQQAAKTISTPATRMLPSQFLGFLKTHLATLAASSRRQYLASVKLLLGNPETFVGRLQETGFKADLNLSYSELSQITAADFIEPYLRNRDRSLLRTSQQKAKKVDLKILKMLMDVMLQSDRTWDRLAIIWLSVNVIVGLRPSEWRTACIEASNDLLFLRVMNAKNTNGRAHSEVRRINITHLNKAEINLVKYQLSVVSHHNQSQEAWDSYYHSARQALRRAGKKIKYPYKKQPSLYSSRHQFAANAKSSGFGKAEIAAMMGHASENTATGHYGKKRYGSRRLSVLPAEEDVMKVRAVSKKRIMEPKLG